MRRKTTRSSRGSRQQDEESASGRRRRRSGVPHGQPTVTAASLPHRRRVCQRSPASWPGPAEPVASSAGSPGGACAGPGAGWVRCSCRTTASLRWMNGGCPARHSNSTQAEGVEVAPVVDLLERGDLLRAHVGRGADRDARPGEPVAAARRPPPGRCRSRAAPRPRVESTTLSGFTSRWTMPWPWAWSSASSRSSASRRVSAMDSVPPGPDARGGSGPRRRS